MKKKILTCVFSVTLLATAVLFTGAATDNNAITRENDMTVVNTTTLARDVKGFKGATPVKIYIKKNKIVKIETLPNSETPNYFTRAKELLKAWNGKAVSKAASTQPDAVSGATFSSNALIKNVQAGLKYYQKNQ